MTKLSNVYHNETFQKQKEKKMNNTKKPSEILHRFQTEKRTLTNRNPTLKGFTKNINKNFFTSSTISIRNQLKR